MKNEGLIPQAINKALEEDVQTSEEAAAKSISALTETKHPKQMTELNEREIKQLTPLHTLAEEFDIEILRKVTNNFEKLRVSTSRKGRQEILEVGRAARESHEQQSKWKRLLGLRG